MVDNIHHPWRGCVRGAIRIRTCGTRNEAIKSIDSSILGGSSWGGIRGEGERPSIKLLHYAQQSLPKLGSLVQTSSWKMLISDVDQTLFMFLGQMDLCSLLYRSRMERGKTMERGRSNCHINLKGKKMTSYVSLSNNISWTIWKGNQWHSWDMSSFRCWV